jgi:hypothetical protein
MLSEAVIERIAAGALTLREGAGTGRPGGHAAGGRGGARLANELKSKAITPNR